jgi:hypothetical protein
MNSYTDPQLDAIMSAGEQRPDDFKGMKMSAVAAKLAAEGHPLFKGQTFTSPTAPATAPTTSAAEAANGLDLPPARTAQAAPVVATTQAQPAAAPQLPATREHHAVARPAQVSTGLEGLESLTQEDIRIPRLAIRQQVGGGSEAEHVPQGAIYLSLDPDGHAPKRLLRVLDVQPGRSFLMPYGNSKEAKSKQAATRNQLFKAHGVSIPDEAQAACSSPDRNTPEDRGWGTLAKSCEACPYSKWKTVGGQRVAPECGENYRLLVLDEASGAPAVWWARKTAIAALKNLATNLLISGRRDKRPPAGYRVEMSTAKDGDGTNSWHVPKFGPLAKTTDAELEEGLALRRALMSAVNEEREEAAPAAAGEAA